MFEKTLIPVSYGERPEEMKKIGKILKNLGSTSICLFHVIEAGTFFRGSDISWMMILKETLEELGLDVEVKMGADHIASSIAEAALHEGADEIYMKTKRRWQIGTMLLGSISRDLLRLSDIPVFVHKVRPRLPGDETVITREDLTILYATDFGEASVRPIPYLMEFQGGWCHILHVRGRMADPFAEEIEKRRLHEKLLAVEVELRPYYGRVTSEQIVGDPSYEVLHVSDQINADVIVLGRKKPAFFSAPMGETAERIVTSSRASIFLVP